MTENSARHPKTAISADRKDPKQIHQSAREYLTIERRRREAAAEKLRIVRVQAQEQGRQL
jgi:hypothetical protein